MKLAKSLLLGSAAALAATTGYAADLPAKKAAPVSYVKVCDAYGAGFFYIPGTETCIKVGGRVRADYAMSGKADQNASNVFAPTDGSNVVGGYYYTQVGNGQATASSTNFGPAYSTATTGTVSGNYMLGQSLNNAEPGFPYYYTMLAGSYTSAGTYTNRTVSVPLNGPIPGYTAANGVSKRASNLYGWEARARVDIDARTATAYGTVQAVASLRMGRTTGILDQNGPALSAASAAPTLEAAYVRFAGFTFGVAKDNFSFMPSTFYGAGHWSSFANGAKQLAYTAVLGGGFSATLGIQDAADTTAGGAVALGQVVSGVTGYNTYTTPGWGYLITPLPTDPTGAVGGTPAYSYNNMPQLNGRIDLDQGWGSASIMGAVGKAVGVNATTAYDKDKSVYAVGGGLKVNLPAIAAGDVLWLNAAYADGMTEYTTNWTSFKSSDTKRNVGGYVTNHPSWVVTSNGIETLKSWDVAAIYTHFWAPQWRHSFLATYGAIQGTDTSKALAWSMPGAYGDAKVWNVGTQLTWLPAKDFEIGVDVLYARVEQDIRRFGGTTSVSSYANDTAYYVTTAGQTKVSREKAGNVTGRLRVERTF